MVHGFATGPRDRKFANRPLAMSTALKHVWMYCNQQPGINP